MKPASRFVPCLLLVIASACMQPAETDPPEISTAKAPASPGVLSTDPSFGYGGEVGKVVTINGSGFDAGSTARWERNGAPDPKITVVSTQFVNASQLKATISIAPDAALAFYDVAVITSRGRKGIGTELFEVTQAVPVTGTSNIRAANEAGTLGGIGAGSPRLWSHATGLVVLPEEMSAGGGVTAIDEAGLVATGFEGGAIGVTPLWTLAGGTWQYAALPDDPAAVGGHGWAIASDPGTGNAVFIAGFENFKGKGQSTVSKPRLWKKATPGWERVVLPSFAADGSGVAEDVTPAGTAVGKSNGRAVIWEPDGMGNWSIAYLPGTEFTAKGINSAATLIGGGSIAYWTRVGTGPWVLAHLPGSCRAVMAVDDGGRIAADNCEGEGRVTRPGIFLPPYTDPPIMLGSLGAKGSAANVEKMSLNGSWIVGNISGSIGVYWKIF